MSNETHSDKNRPTTGTTTAVWILGAAGVWVGMKIGGIGGMVIALILWALVEAAIRTSFSK